VGCRRGGCGTCRVQVSAGEYILGKMSAAEISEADRAAGIVLACQQRKGLRIGTPAADGRPRYVLDIEPASGTVLVGPAESLAVHELRADRPRWCAPAPTAPFDAPVQIRAHGDAVPARA